MIFTTIYHSARFYCIVVTIEFYDFHFSLTNRHGNAWCTLVEMIP